MKHCGLWPSLAILLLLPFLSTEVRGEDTERPLIRFSCSSNVEMPDFQYALGIYRQVFSELGYRFEMVSLPTEEAIRLLRLGQIDGDCGRVKGFAELSGLPSLIRVKTALRQGYYAAWSKRGLLAPDTLSLPNRAELRFGYLRGRAFLESNLEKMGYAHTETFASMRSGIESLRVGKIDVWLDYEAVFSGQHKTLLKDDIKIVGPIASIPVYPFLLKKHEPMLKALAFEVSRLKDARPYLHDFSSAKGGVRSKKKTITFGCSMSEKLPQFVFLEDRFGESFAALGYQFKMIPMSIYRSEVELMAGRIDGSCARTDVFIKRHPSAIKVNIEPFPASYQAWVTDPTLMVDGLASLKGKEYKVGFVRGTYRLEEALSSYPQKFVRQVANPISGMNMLAKGELDLFIDSAARVQGAIHHLQVDIPLYMMGDIYPYKVYPVMGPGHGVLADAFARELNRRIELLNTKDAAEYDRPPLLEANQ